MNYSITKKLTMGLLLFILVSAQLFGASEMFANGSFEDEFTGWDNNFGRIGGYPIDRGTFWSTDGAYGIDLIGTGPSDPGYVEQELYTEAGQEYVLSFDLHINGGAPALVVTIDGNSQNVSSTGSHTIAFTATSTLTTVRFEANAYYNYLYNNVLLDNVSSLRPSPTSLGISGWEMNRGGGYISLGITLAYHGDPAVYAWANIPLADNANWGPAPNTETIGFSERSYLPGVLTYADFTYFQTFLSIPENTQINDCYVDFRNADDGAQITIYNSLYPNGHSPAGANIRLGGPGQTADITQWIADGEVNRVVITQVDNQAVGNNLGYAAIVLNGTPILLNQAPTADAGADQTIGCAVGSADVTLSGSGSDDDGDDLTYTWSSNGSTVGTGSTITTSQGAGSQTYTLTVFDGTVSATDEVTVTVNTDAIAPALTVPGNISVSNDEGVCGAAVSFDINATDACGVTSLVAVPASGSLFEVGTTTVNVTASDATGNTSTASFTVTVNDTEKPVIAALEDIDQSNDPGVCGAAVYFEPEVSDNCEVATISAVPVSGSFFEVGTTTVTVTATDAAGNTSESTFEVTVEDNEAPTFTAVGDPTIMWSPNHKYRTFDAADFVVSVDDNCSDLSAADVTITHVTSDEVEDAKGKGDGKTKNDMVISGSSVDLRSERQGGGNGRVYTIYMSVEDENGNSSTASAQVHVTHNKKSTAIDDGAVYTVNASSLARAAGFEDITSDMLIPEDFALEQNYPNPFNPSTMISYSMPEAGHASLTVYDIRGSIAAQLSSGYQSAGIHSISFDASALTAGSYIYVLNVNGQRFTRKMLLLK